MAAIAMSTTRRLKRVTVGRQDGTPIDEVPIMDLTPEEFAYLKARTRRMLVSKTEKITEEEREELARILDEFLEEALDAAELVVMDGAR
jgi:FMN-dependent NADH-azoreductase